MAEAMDGDVVVHDDDWDHYATARTLPLALEAFREEHPDYEGPLYTSTVSTYAYRKYLGPLALKDALERGLELALENELGEGPYEAVFDGIASIPEAKWAELRDHVAAFLEENGAVLSRYYTGVDTYRLDPMAPLAGPYAKAAP